MEAVIAASRKAVESEAYAAAVAECKARNAPPETVEIVMRTILGTADKIGVEIEDADARAAYIAAMKVFYYATLTVLDEAGDAFDNAYAESMSKTKYLSRAS